MSYIEKSFKKIISVKDPSPKIISLFSGCGGLDLPFHRSGYNLVWANDFDESSCQTFEKNISNQFDVTVICLAETQLSRITDDINEVIDYNKLIKLIYNIFNKKRYKLVEKLAFDIANEMKLKFGIKKYKISIKKITPLINNPIDSFEVIYGNLDD